MATGRKGHKQRKETGEEDHLDRDSLLQRKGGSEENQNEGGLPEFHVEKTVKK